MNYSQFLNKPYDSSDEQNQTIIKVCLKFFGSIAILWELSELQKRAILALSNSHYKTVVLESKLCKLDSDVEIKLLVRLSWLATVRKEIELFFPDTYWYEYVNAPNRDLGDKSLVDIMVETEEGLFSSQKLHIGFKANGLSLTIPTALLVMIYLLYRGQRLN